MPILLEVWCQASGAGACRPLGGAWFWFSGGDL